MRSRLYRHLQISCVGFIGVAIGLLVGSHLVKVPALVRPPLHRSGDAEEALGRVIPEVDLEGAPFYEAVEKVRKLSPVPIVVDWKKLSKAAVDIRAPVTFRARDATLGRVLSELVQPVETAQTYVGYAPAGDLVLISTSDDVTRLSTIVRSYDVQDILRPPANPWDNGGIPEPIINDGPFSGAVAPAPLSREEKLQQLVQDSVAADSWVANGGQIGSIRFIAGKMVVVQTYENHRQIANLLGQLRETPDPIASPPPTPDLKLWNDTLKKYVSTNPSVGEAALQRHLPEVRFDRVPLEQAVTTLAELAPADLIVDWGPLELAKVHDRTPVSVRLHDVTLAEALHALLNAAGAGQVDFRINGGVVIMGLPKEDDYGSITRVYDIRDWLTTVMGPPPTPAPKTPADLRNWNALEDAYIDRLVGAIEATIAPDSWKEAGGAVGTIREFNRQLIVQQTYENQERVADLLAALRIDPSRLRLSPASVPVTRP